MPCICLAVMVTSGIVISVLFDFVKIFNAVSLEEFVILQRWLPDYESGNFDPQSFSLLAMIPPSIFVLSIPTSIMISIFPLTAAIAIYIGQNVSPAL